MSVGLRFAGVAAVVGGLLLSMGVQRAAAAPAPLPVAAPAPLAAAGTAQLAAAKPHTRVTLSVPARVPPGARVSLTGQVRPGHAGGRVQLQVKESGTWRRAATARLSRRSTYTFHRAFRTPGAAVTLRVVLPAHSDHRLGVSRTRTVRTVPPGFDVSYPQCGTAAPAGSFGLVGADGGRPFDVNPCLAEQLTWALGSGPPAYYVNTANPGPRLSRFWPLGQASPRACATTYPASDSTACAFDYGWNAAASSYARAATAAVAAAAPPVSTATWWLDVELRNTWESVEYGETTRYLTNDVAVLQGMAAYLHAQGVRTVGVYSTAHQWLRVTGGVPWRQAPVWYAGVGSPTSALAHCSLSFTGGRVRMAQYASSQPPGFDANHRC